MSNNEMTITMNNEQYQKLVSGILNVAEAQMTKVSNQCINEINNAKRDAVNEIGNAMQKMAQMIELLKETNEIARETTERMAQAKADLEVERKANELQTINLQKARASLNLWVAKEAEITNKITAHDEETVAEKKNREAERTNLMLERDVTQRSLMYSVMEFVPEMDDQLKGIVERGIADAENGIKKTQQSMDR